MERSDLRTSNLVEGETTRDGTIPQQRGGHTGALLLTHFAFPDAYSRNVLPRGPHRVTSITCQNAGRSTRLTLGGAPTLLRDGGARDTLRSPNMPHYVYGQGT